MINKFGGTCAKCRKLVAPGAGELEKTNVGWRLTHIRCPTYESLGYVGDYDGHGYDDDFTYETTGMTEADWRDALNPDEGDKG